MRAFNLPQCGSGVIFIIRIGAVKRFFSSTLWLFSSRTFFPCNYSKSPHSHTAHSKASLERKKKRIKKVDFFLSPSQCLTAPFPPLFPFFLRRVLCPKEEKRGMSGAETAAFTVLCCYQRNGNFTQQAKPKFD